jgi:glyoxylase-like metal-dependent hydrolase (beta-lactamase superfamily II)
LKASYIFTNFPIFSKTLGKRYLICTSFLIFSPKYGAILFDTGSPYDTDSLLSFINKNYDLSPLDIKWVFNTHIHPDHVGANGFFKKANIILSRKDLNFAAHIAEVVFQNKNLLAYLHANCPGYINTFDDYEAENMKKYIKDCWSDEKLGLNLNPKFIEDNPEIPDFIKIIPSFGHTFNHYSYLLELENINILVSGDALSMRMILKENHDNRYQEPHMDFDSYFKSLDIIKKFSGLIIPGHDRPFFSNTLRSIRKNCFDLIEINKFIMADNY